jgi:hypothetical protein
MLDTMPVCPFCQTDLAMPSLPCRNCGRRMAEHPSLAEGKSYSVKPQVRTSGSMEAVRSRPPAASALAPGVASAPAQLSPSDGVSLSPQDVPELQLATRHAPKPPKPPSLSPASGAKAEPAKAPSLPPSALPKKPSAARGATGPRPSGQTSAVSIPGVGGAVFDEDDIFAPQGGGAPLELDTAGSPTPAPRPPPPTSSGKMPREAARDGAEPNAASPPDRGQALERIQSHELEVDDPEVATLADYGDPPQSFWQAPLYTYRVKMRQSELRAQLTERKNDLARARQAEEQAKLEFADRARDAARRIETYAGPLEAIATAEKLMLQRDGALSAELEAHRARLAVIDERVAGLTAELAEARGEERKIEASLAEAEAIRQRADAKLKRAEIEIRNASSLADQATAAQRDSAKRAGLP